jgi:hypothetical protein
LRKAAIWISLSKWPMLQTIARSFMCRMRSIVITSMLPGTGPQATGRVKGATTSFTAPAY